MAAEPIKGSGSIHLKKVEEKYRGCLEAKYGLKHITPGPGGTHLEQDLTLTIDRDGATASITLTDCRGSSPEEAMERMANWLRRMAIAIEQRKGESIPVA
jgi:hypothetical protein